MSAQHC